MKLTFTFILTCLFVTSLIGQTEKAMINRFGKIHQQNSEIRDFENLEGVIAQRLLLKDFPFNDFKVSMLKSAQTATQLLDSTVDENVDAATGKMVISGKTLNTYNSNGKQTLSITYSWDKSFKKWIGNYKNEYAYDLNGNKTGGIYYSWDKINSMFIVFHKYEYSYDSNGNITLYIIYSWDKSISNWVGSEMTEYTYDSNGNNTQDIYYSWEINTSKWVDSYKKEYAYDSNGNMTLQIGYSWNISANNWIASNKYESTYNSNGNITLVIIYRWDTSNSKWAAAYSKGEYTYDSNGNKTQYIDYNWDKSVNKWVGNWKNESAYDSNGNIVLNSNYTWDKVNSKWIGFWKGEYSYINDNNKYIQSFNRIYTWNISSNNWEISNQSTYYYSQHEVTGNLNVLNVDMKIYPNPATNGFRVSGLAGAATIILSDINGKVLFSKEVANDSYVSTDALPHGIYFVRINTGEGSIVKKLIKK